MNDTRSIPFAKRLEGALARWIARLPNAWLRRMIREPVHVVDGSALDAHVQFVLAARRRKYAYGMIEPSVAEGRERNRTDIAAVAPPPTVVAGVQALAVQGAAGMLPARHYSPLHAEAQSTPLLVFLHGGGFVIGDLDTHDEPCRQLCRDGAMHVVSVAYRLAPEHPFPCAVDDAIAAVCWAQDHADTLGVDRSLVCVGGDSAGGNLAAAASLALARVGRPVAAQLLIYPALDANAEHPSRRSFRSGYILEQRDLDAFRLCYLGPKHETGFDPRASPQRDPDLARSPATLVLTAGFDPLRDEGNRFAATLRHAGVPVVLQRADALVHGFLHLTGIVPAAHEAVGAMARAFRRLVDETAAVRRDHV